MASQTLREDPAVCLLAFPNRDSKGISKDAQHMGLNYLKAEVSSVKVMSVLDLVQPRYALFKAFFPAFVWSSVYNKPTLSAGQNFRVSVDDMLAIRSLMPLKPPPVIIAWSDDIPAETFEKVRNTIVVTETSSGGKPAFEYRPSSWNEIDKVKGLGANILATANIGFCNIKTFLSCKSIIASLTAAFHAIRYPAFEDHEHKSGFMIGDFASETIDVDDSDSKDFKADYYTASEFEKASAPADFDDLALQNVPLWKISYTNLPDALPYINIDDASVKLPPGEGLWFPYYAFLNKYDTEQLPSFLRKYMVNSLGTTVDASIASAVDLCADWGVIGKTDTGKEISHMVKCLEIALESQARPIAVFRREVYQGTVLKGTGFTLIMNGVMKRPVSELNLHNAIERSDGHAAAIRLIGGKMGNKEQTAQVTKVSSMLELRNVLLAGWTKERDREEILKAAAYLNFREKKWSSNLSTVQFALKSIADPNFVMSSAPIDRFPLHHSMLFETDTLACVWSCFGDYAPSFRVPGGATKHLAEDMTFDVTDRKGVKQTKKLVRIAVRSKELVDAIEDLRAVQKEQSIMNPIALPKVRVSSENMDKLYTGKDGTELLGSLREFVGLSASGKSQGKRRAEDLLDIGSSKRIKGGAVDLSGW